MFYRTYAQPDDNLPRCFYVDHQPPFVIALENVSERGYHPCPYIKDIPAEYTLAAVRELALFHAKGYVMKELRREKFLDIVAGFRKIKFNESIDDNLCKLFVRQNSTRAVEYLRRHNYDTDFCDKMETYLSNPLKKFVWSTFCNSMILFSVIFNRVMRSYQLTKYF